MALIKPFALAKLCTRNHIILYTAVRNHWNKDYIAHPYPKTQEEREAAAKKYGLDIEEYKPMSDYVDGYGDYPNLPAISGDARDPHYPWDMPELKRNFNETMCIHDDIITENRVNVNKRVDRWSPRARLHFFAFYLLLFLMLFPGSKLQMFPPVVPPQYPLQGKTHYTFELKE